MTRPKGQMRVIAQDQSFSLSFAVYLGLLSANLLGSVQISMVHIMLSLLTYLIFCTHV